LFVFVEFLIHWWADFPTGYCPIDRGSEIPTIYCRSNWSVPQILIQYITSGWPIHFIKFLEIFIHFLWKSQFQVFDHCWSLPFYLWLVSCTNNKCDWCIQTIQQEVYNYTRKCMNISRNLIKWIGRPKVMYWINIWGTLQLERQ
jgi:hypothetical protein